MANRRHTTRNRNRRSPAQNLTQRSRAFVHAQLEALAARLPAAAARRLRRFEAQLQVLEHRIDRANHAGAQRYQRFEHRLRSELASRIRELERVIAKGGRRSAQA